MTNKYTIAEINYAVNGSSKPIDFNINGKEGSPWHMVQQLLDDHETMRRALEFYSGADVNDLIEDFGQMAGTTLGEVTK